MSKEMTFIEIWNFQKPAKTEKTRCIQRGIGLVGLPIFGPSELRWKVLEIGYSSTHIELDECCVKGDLSPGFWICKNTKHWLRFLLYFYRNSPKKSLFSVLAGFWKFQFPINGNSLDIIILTYLSII